MKKEVKSAPQVRPKTLIKILVKAIIKGRQVLISGAPGIGKTDLVKRAVELIRESGKEINLIILHPVVSDPTDFKGFPALVNGEARFLPFGYLKKMIDANVLTVVFFDDLGQATAAVQAAAMQLLLGREVNNQRIAEVVRFVAATNRKEDLAGVQSILEPVKSRFDTIVELVPDPLGWNEWAEKNSIHYLVRAYIMRKPEMLFKPNASRDMVNTPSPRTVANVSKWAHDWQDEDEILGTVIEGAAGAEFAQDFMAFKSIANRMIDPRICIRSPDTAPVPDEVDIHFALTLALAELANGENWSSIMQYSKRLGQEFEKLLVTSATRRDKKLQFTEAYIQWATENPELQN